MYITTKLAMLVFEDYTHSGKSNIMDEIVDIGKCIYFDSNQVKNIYLVVMYSHTNRVHM